ncbi:Fic family protein [Candidatus Woesebacteria bacterium]|nr:MAG: Fic family protein [Candidatus Woesebacteria bacterium]
MYSPKFSITNKILQNIGAIEACKEVIENAPLVPYYEKQFKSEAIVRTVHHATHIEGNDLSLDQTKKVLEGEQVLGRERDIQEVINYRNVVSLLDELMSKRGGYDLQTLTDIHKETVKRLVPDEKVGVLRKTQVVIKEEETGEIIFQPPPFIEIPYLLEDFFIWLNSESTKEIHPVLLSGIVHYVLVSIHPFVEGNGRSTRAFSTLVLMREGYDIKRFFSLEEYFDMDPGDYYEAFSVTDKQSRDIAARDLTYWLEYFTKALSISLGKVKDKIRKLSIDSKLMGRIGHQVALTERQMQLVEYLSENGSGIMKELKTVLPMVSEDTVLRDVKDLLDKNIVKKEGSTKASRYYLTSSSAS